MFLEGERPTWQNQASTIGAKDGKRFHIAVGAITKEMAIIMKKMLHQNLTCDVFLAQPSSLCEKWCVPYHSTSFRSGLRIGLPG